MDFLLECVGFPPDQDQAELVERVRARGEPAPWRGPGGVHLRHPLGGGLELRLDRDEGDAGWTLSPYLRSERRVRVAVDEVRRVPDSPFDAFVVGRANPRVPQLPAAAGAEDEYPLAAYVSDARRLAGGIERGHVLALGLAGFALDVSYVGEDGGGEDPTVTSLPHGARLAVLGGEGDPGGCMEVSLQVVEAREFRNPLSGRPFDVLEAAAPGRRLPLLVSRWALEAEGLPAPRAGMRVEGAFLFSGRVAGGLPSPATRARGRFG